MTVVVSGSAILTLFIPYLCTVWILCLFVFGLDSDFVFELSSTGIENELLIAVLSCMNVLFVRSVSGVDAFMIVSPADIVFSCFLVFWAVSWVSGVDACNDVTSRREGASVCIPPTPPGGQSWDQKARRSPW